MTIILKNLPSFKKGSRTQQAFTITPTILRNNLGEVLNRVLYCNPRHVAYVVKRGELVAVLQMGIYGRH